MLRMVTDNDVKDKNNDMTINIFTTTLIIKIMTTHDTMNRHLEA